METNANVAAAPARPPINLSGMTRKKRLLSWVPKKEEDRRLVARSARLAIERLPVSADDILDWVREVFPSKVAFPFSEDHKAIYRWAAEITPEHTPEPLVAILPRGGGKTTTLDLICAYLLAHKIVNCILIVAANMAKSRARVRSIRSLLESTEFRRRYPDVGEPALTARGHQKAWKNDLLVNEAGQAVIATSFEADSRGFNEETGLRPDLIVCDDMDKQFDTLTYTIKKESVLVNDILPTEGSKPAAVVFIQNLIKAGGMAARLVSREAPYWKDRRLIGPTLAVDGLRTERRVITKEIDGEKVEIPRDVIVEGVATWEGQSLEACQDKIDRWGLSTFLYEQQHEVLDLEGALLRDKHFRTRPAPKPEDIVEAVVGVDPSGGRTECGIVACASLRDGYLCTLVDRTQYMGEDGEWAKVAVLTAYQVRGDIVVETTYGGKTITDALLVAARELQTLGMVPGLPRIYTVAPHYSKAARAWPPAQMYKQGLVYHVEGEDFAKLKTEWTTWVQGESKNSPNRMDAEVHAMNHLMTARDKRPAPANVDRW